MTRYPSHAFGSRPLLSAARLALSGLVGLAGSLAFFWLFLLPGIDEEPSGAPLSGAFSAYRASWEAAARRQAQLARWSRQEDGFGFPALARASGFGPVARGQPAPTGGSAGHNDWVCAIEWPLGNETRSAVSGQALEAPAVERAALFVLAHEQTHCLAGSARGLRLMARPLPLFPSGSAALDTQLALARLSALAPASLPRYADPNALREEAFADIRALLFLRQNSPPLEWAATLDQVFSRRALSETPFSLVSDHASEGAIWALAAAARRLPARLSADQIDRVALSLAHIAMLDYFSAERDHGDDGWTQNIEAASMASDADAASRLAALKELSALARPLARDPMWSKAATERALGAALPADWQPLRARLGFSNAGSLLAVRSQIHPLALVERRSARLLSEPGSAAGPQETARLLYQRQLSLDLARMELLDQLGLPLGAALDVDEQTLRQRELIRARGR